MTTKINNKYVNLKNYELEEMFDLSKKQKEKLINSIDSDQKHILKLKEMYLKQKIYDFDTLEQEICDYVNNQVFDNDLPTLSLFYELLVVCASENNNTKEYEYLDKSIDAYPTQYCIKRAIYYSLKQNKIHKAARYLLRALEADIKLDQQIEYYNLVIEHYFEDDILEYNKLMKAYKERNITVNNITIEFSFNDLIIDYYINTKIKKLKISSEEVTKQLDKLTLKVLTNSENEQNLRSEVLRVRHAIEVIDKNKNVDIFKLLTFNLLPPPTGEPTSSPLDKYKKLS